MSLYSIQSISNSIGAAANDGNGTPLRTMVDRLTQDFIAMNSALAFDDAGGIYLGGTAAANKIDDYEEGSFTATLSQGATTSPTTTLFYIKIGTAVLIFGPALFGSHSNDATGIQISGVPFVEQERVQFAANGAARINYSTSEVPFWQLNSSVLSLLEIPTASTTSSAITSSASSQNPSYGEFNFAFRTA